MERWFDYPVRVHPHHTDYGSIVWHGTYVAWMEEARVDCLRSLGSNYADWVNLGCDLQVVELSLRYHRPLRMGMVALVKARPVRESAVRMVWHYRIEDEATQVLCLSALVVLAPVDRHKGKIMRRLPPQLQADMDTIMAWFNQPSESN